MRPPFLAVLLLAAACSGAPRAVAVTEPGETLAAWRQAIERDDPRAGYALLSPRVRKGLSFVEFERQWKESAAERKRQAGALAATPTGVEAVAEVTLADGKKTRLSRDKAFWRLETPLVSASRASTPQEALRLFAAALEDRSFPAVMRLFTSTRRDGLDAELDAFVAGLRGNVGREIIITGGDRAIIEWREGQKVYKLVLKKENGEWRIDDLDF
jgi:hypothetical protein